MKEKTKKVYSKIAFIIFGIFLQFMFSSMYENYKNIEVIKKQYKKDQISKIDKQLNEFYIPLKIKLDKSKRLFMNYKKKYSNDDLFVDIKNAKERLEWQRYVLAAFQPIHTEISLILSNKRQLMDKNNKLENQLNLLEQHIVYYKVIFIRWKDNDVSKNFSPTKFPKYLASHLKNEIIRLKAEKNKLLSE